MGVQIRKVDSTFVRSMNHANGFCCFLVEESLGKKSVPRSTPSRLLVNFSLEKWRFYKDLIFMITIRTLHQWLCHLTRLRKQTFVKDIAVLFLLLRCFYVFFGGWCCAFSLRKKFIFIYSTDVSDAHRHLARDQTFMLILGMKCTQFKNMCCFSAILQLLQAYAAIRRERYLHRQAIIRHYLLDQELKVEEEKIRQRFLQSQRRAVLQRTASARLQRQRHKHAVQWAHSVHLPAYVFISSFYNCPFSLGDFFNFKISRIKSNIGQIEKGWKNVLFRVLTSLLSPKGTNSRWPSYEVLTRKQMGEGRDIF